MGPTTILEPANCYLTGRSRSFRSSKPSILVPVVMSESRRAYWRGALFSRFVIISTSTSTCDQFACWKVSGAHFVGRKGFHRNDSQPAQHLQENLSGKIR